MLDRLEIVAAKLRRKFSRNLLTGRYFHRPAPAEHSDEIGLILIQVDGLGESVLRKAIRDGHMPFVRMLVERDGHRIYPLYSGLPSNTPAFQAEFFYGARSAVPAFCFRDPKLERTLSMNAPFAAAAIEARLKERHRGLLRGGSSWSNIFSGGAAEPHLCAATVGLRSALGTLAPRRLLTLFFLHGWSFVRVGANTIAVGALAFWDLLRGRLPLRDFWRELRFVPLRVAVSVAMREIVTVGAAVDASRGLPVIQLNFLGYDEHAHRRGPESGFARWSLRGIDGSIRRVWMAAHRSHRRDYEAWIYSDHGQEAVTPFSRRYGERVPEVVRRLYNELVVEPPVEESIQEHDPGYPTGDRALWLGSKRLSTLARQEREPRKETPPTRFEITHQGPAGFIYLPRRHDEGFVSTLALRLVRDGKIPGVVVRAEHRKAIAFTERGRFVLPEEAAEVFGSTHPHLHEVARDTVRLSHHDYSGQLMLLGWRPGDPLSLQHEFGSHGGPGPNETSAFVLLPPEAVSHSHIQDKLRPASLRAMAMRVLRSAEGPPTERVTYTGPIVRRTERKLEVPLRIMTYNVHGCRGVDGVYSPHRIARVIARERPDVVCLQELDEGRQRSAGVDQTQRIARRLKVDYHFHAISETDGGRFGNAVLSLLPMSRVISGPLPRLTRQVINLWDRGALWVSLEIDGVAIHVINTHLSVFPRERKLQIEALLGEGWLSHPDCQGNVILAGDMNASPKSRNLRLLESRMRNVVDPRTDPRPLRTWTGRIPLRRIDHVLVSGDIEVENVHVPRNRLARVASDHLPLVVDVVCRVPLEAAGDPREVLEDAGSIAGS